MKKLILIATLCYSCGIKPTHYAGRYKKKELKEIPSPLWMVVGTITLFTFVR